MTIPGLLLFSCCFAQAVFGQNLYNDYFGAGATNRIGNTVDIIGGDRTATRGSVTSYSPFFTGQNYLASSTWNRGSNLGSSYLNRRRFLRRRGDSSEERVGGIYNRFYRRRRGDSSEERGRGIFNRYNRYNRFNRWDKSASSEERGWGRRGRLNRRFRSNSSEERRGGRFGRRYNWYTRRWGSGSRERRGRWGRLWGRGSRSNENSGEWRRRRFGFRRPYRDVDDSGEWGNRPYRRRNYRGIINRLRSPYPYYNNNYYYGNRLNLFGNRWNL